ncbi:MAG: cytochrome c oxidase assembly protein [Deinococcus sp.]
MRGVWLFLAGLGVALACWLYSGGQMTGHMLAHLLLSLIVPPLLLLAAPRWRPRVLPWLGFLALATVTAVSHLPLSLALVDRHPGLLAAEGAAFFCAGLLFALALWPATVASLAVTLGQMAVCALTGAWVGFGSRMAGGPAAGTLMWVGGGLLYSLAALAIVARLVSREGEPIHVH